MEIYDGFVYILYFEEKGDNLVVYMSDDTTVYIKNTPENKEKLLKQMENELLEITADGKLDKIRKEISSNKNLTKIDALISTYALLLSFFVPNVIKIIIGLIIAFLAVKIGVEIKNFKELEVKENKISNSIAFIKDYEKKVAEDTEKIINEKKNNTILDKNIIVNNIDNNFNKYEESNQKVRTRIKKK